MPKLRTPGQDRSVLRTRGPLVSIALVSLIVGLGSSAPAASSSPPDGRAPEGSVSSGRRLQARDSGPRPWRWPREVFRPESRRQPAAQRRPPVRKPAEPRPTGRLALAPGRSRVHGTGPLLTFDVRVEGGLGLTPRAFADEVEGVLFSPRGWTRGNVSFQRVSGTSAEIHVILASPALTDRLCAPALTRGRFSCHNDGNVVINFWRWTNGADSYRGDLERYRDYVVNHEVGHALGRGHVDCPAAGARAPVMMQQTIGLGACRTNPWPAPYELP